MKKSLIGAAVAALIVSPLAAQATVYTFNAMLNGSSEVPGNASPATGLAILTYNDFGTVSMADDRYDFALSVFNLSAPVTAYHIHGAATPTENAPVRVGLDAAPFVGFNNGGTLLVGGNGVAAPTIGANPIGIIPATPPSATNAGHPSMTFIEMLRGGLAYVNVHTTLIPSGEVRGQLFQVSAVPEPEAYALMLAGLGLVGISAMRRRQH